MATYGSETAAREMYPHERAADEWQRTMTMKNEAEEAFRQAQRRLEEATSLEQQTWLQLEEAAGRGPAKPPPPNRRLP